MVSQNNNTLVKDPFLLSIKKSSIHSIVNRHRLLCSSACLNRTVKVDIFLLPGFEKGTTNRAVLINDGQDMERLQLSRSLAALYSSGLIPNLVCVAIHADRNRLEEYGTAESLDYKKRGKKAGAYSDFITEELTPFLQSEYSILQDPEFSAFVGFSMGGLSALNISWRNPALFSKLGIFSGSLWWRYAKKEKKGIKYHRIMHEIVRNSQKREGMRFWFQAGTKDESHDRNNSGTIDSIEDTVDLMTELEKLGYTEDEIEFELIEGGEHNFKTWSKIFPKFLIWAFNYEKYRA